MSNENAKEVGILGQKKIFHFYQKKGFNLDNFTEYTPFERLKGDYSNVDEKIFNTEHKTNSINQLRPESLLHLTVNSLTNERVFYASPGKIYQYALIRYNEGKRGQHTDNPLESMSLKVTKENIKNGLFTEITYLTKNEIQKIYEQNDIKNKNEFRKLINDLRKNHKTEFLKLYSDIGNDLE